MSDNEHVDRLTSIWKDSPTTRADVEDRYPGLAWAIEGVLDAFDNEADEPESKPKIECPELPCACSFVGEHRFRELLDHYMQYHRVACSGGVNVIDAAHLKRQRGFSRKTFGPGIRRGVVDHLRKELDEVEDSDLTDLDEWVDIVILGLDGAWRAGHEPQEIIDVIKDKQTRNEARTWPDWRTTSTDKAIEHDRGRER